MIRVLLFYAESMTITFTGKLELLRNFMRYLKFFGLLFSIKKNQYGWNLHLDGPEAVLDSSRSYGINFSNLLPSALALKGEWEINANIQIDKNRYQLTIKPEDNYQTSHKKSEYFRQQKITDFIKNWKQEKTNAYFSSDILMLKENIYLLPDIKISHKNKNYYLEWVQYPLGNKELLAKKISFSPPNYFFLIIAPKKKFDDFSDKIKKRIIFFSKNFIQSKIEDTIYVNKNQKRKKSGSNFYCKTL